MEPETKEQTEIVLLEKVITESGLQLNESEEIKGSYLPFLSQLEEIKSNSSKINYENPTEIDEKIARDLRLRTVKIRTGAESLKDSRKKIHLLKGNLEQASFNIIKASCQLAEETFIQVEKAREIAEAKRKEALKAERLELLQPLTEQASIYPLGEMSQEAFNDLLNGFKLQAEAKKAAELKAEQERLLAIEAEKKRQAEIEAENKKLKEQAKIAEAKAQEERKKAEIEKAKQDAIHKAEQEKQDAIMEAQRKEAAKIKAIADAKLAKEKAENDRLKAELKAKQDAEAKAKSDAEHKAEEEKKAQIKAAKAPKKQKLNIWMDGFVIGTPIGMNEDETVKNILIKFEAFKKWAKEQIETI